MIILSSRFNTFFPKVNNLRKRAFEIEDKLNGQYSQVNIFALPDDAPESIPRLQTSSINGHSIIEISLTNAQVNVSFDENYQTDPNKCLVYLKERAELVKEAMSSIVEDEYLFSGMTIDLIIDSNEPAVNLIKDKFLNYKSEVDPYDIEYKITFVIEQTYYVNLTFKNLRYFEASEISNAGSIEINNIVEVSNHLGINIDVNDRHIFNRNNNYRSKPDSLEQIYSIVHNLFNGKLHKMIEEGVFEL